VTWRIREARPGEAERIARVGAALFRESYEDTHPEPTLGAYLADAFDPRRWRGLLRDPATTVLLVATPDDEWIGYAQLHDGSPADVPTTRLESPLPGVRPVEIVRFYVDARWHGRGVAQALMAACEETARARGAGALWLQAWSQAARPIAFYRKAGFLEWGTAEFRFGERRDADVLLVRPLPPATGGIRGGTESGERPRPS
jgi:GNAT superfamily N-acetyltransferase